MNSIMNIFSTRELSLLIWVAILSTTFLSIKSVRQNSKDLLKILFGKQILTIILLLITLVIGIIFLFYKAHLWDKSLLKDTFFWFFGVALVLSYKSGQAKDFAFFKEIVKDSIKWIIIIEFLVNFYTFSLFIEILLLPIIVIIALLQTISETDKKLEAVTKLMKNITAIFGLFLLTYVSYKTFTNSKALLDLNNLFPFILPIILTIIVLPFIYLLALYINYETLFVRIRCMSKENIIKRHLKKEIFLSANVNLEKLLRISKKLNNYDLSKSDDIKEYIQSLAK